MDIGILGWGSLIWDQRTLQAIDGWRLDGPPLAIEFARISNDGRLTLVIKPHFDLVTVLWTKSLNKDLEHTIQSLMNREGTTSKSDIGFLNFTNQTNSIKRNKESIIISLSKWNEKKKLDAIIWTDLGPNFSDKTGNQFTCENLIKYLTNLQISNPQAYEMAKKYILNAPEQIQTRFRSQLEKSFL